MQKTIKILILLCVIGIIIVYFIPKTRILHCTLGGETLSLEVADTNILRERGLSGHQPLATNEGMIFIFSSDDKYGFWMKEMTFPIDILWLDANYRIVDVKESASPNSYPGIFTPVSPARFVLELSSGFFTAHSLKVGDALQITR